jgi:single-strand DNA-binding protein
MAMARRKTNSTATTPVGEKPIAPEDRPDPITLTGRLCAEPALRKTTTGKSVTTIRLAVNGPDGEATFHSVVLWNRNAEVVCEFLTKGRLVEVKGHEQKRSYTAADGTERQVTEVIAFRVQFLSRNAQTPATEKAVA